MSLKSRLNKLRQKLTEEKVDAFLISQPENRYYLSGFDGWDGFLLITPQDTILTTDFRYMEQAKGQAPDYDIFRITNNIADWFPGLTAELALRRLMFEAGHVTFALYQQMADARNKAKSRLKLVPGNGLVESLRAIKEPEEIEFIIKASAIADSAFGYVEDMIHAGMSEKEVAWEVEKFMREKGSQAVPFEAIVASGHNSALPHAQPSDHAISFGEPIVIDIGAKVGGYCSDLSRTICLGSPDDTFNKVYDTVFDANLVAIATIKEGMTGEEADNLARKVIKQAGYGEAFGHSLGHGIGLAPHEPPRLGPNSLRHLVDGMVFTIEPGIYLAGWGGVRIEDTVVMESGKIRVISRARKI
ncbi:M24 family metallopeptidase [Chloroflexota bacterium]